MQTEILYRPSYSMARVSMSRGETLRAEAGAMVSMTNGITMETQAQGGILKSLGRALLGGESFFVNTFTSGGDGEVIYLAPPLPGDMFEMQLSGAPMLIQSGGFVASAGTVDLDTSWGGGKTFFASEGLFMLKATGTGPVILSSFGAIHDFTLEAGQSMTIDTGHLVAFSEGIGFKIRTIGGVKSTLFSGEGLVVDLTGPGRVLMQSRSQDAFLTWLIPKLPFDRSGS